MIDKNKLEVCWISGMPRSGTTWLSQIFASSPEVRLKFCPLFSYEFKNLLDERSSAEQWSKLFSDVYTTSSEFLDQDHLRKSGLVPSFKIKKKYPKCLVIKSTRFHNLTPNILDLNKEIKFIHLVRHPCASIYSWITNSNEFPSDSDPLMHWKSGACRKTAPSEYWGFDDWKKVTVQALRLNKKYPKRHKIICYEELLADTEKKAIELFNFLDLPFTDRTQSFIQLSHSRHDSHQHSVFKNINFKNQWESLLDKEIISTCINEVVGTELEQFLK
jgi:hypothetical protein